MNKEKKMQIAKNMGRTILLSLRNEGCFDAYVTRFFTQRQCINYLQKHIPEYFSKGKKMLVNWNKLTWLDIFEDEYLVQALITYMMNFNLDDELEMEGS